MGKSPAKRVAIIGLGPAGAITIDAFAQENAFDMIRVFERREAADGQTVHFEDGSKTEDVDAVVIGTGYSWTLPFLPQIPIRNKRVPHLSLHTFHQSDPTLVIIGAVAAGLTFKVFEWQSALAGRILEGRAQLPLLQDQKQWEEDQIRRKGDSVPFTALFPDFGEYFETVRKLAGESGPGQPGRRLPPFDPTWPETFLAGHQRRNQWLRQSNEAALKRVKLAQQRSGEALMRFSDNIDSSLRLSSYQSRHGRRFWDEVLMARYQQWCA